MRSPELLVLGIDAFSHRFFKKYGDSLEILQNFKQRLVDENEYRVLEPSYPTDEPHTGPQWSSIYTGTVPEEHGITSGGWKTDQLDFANLEKKSIFHAFDLDGVSQTVYSMPVTYPSPVLASGACVSGFPSPLYGEAASSYGSERSSSETLASFEALKSKPKNIIQIKSDLPKSDVRGLKPWGQALDDEEYRTVTHRMSKIEVDKMEALLEFHKRDPSEIVYFGSHIVDKAGHIEGLRPKGHMTRIAYNTISRVALRLIADLEPKNWVFISDHGFRMNDYFHDDEGVFITSRELDDYEARITADEVASEICDIAGFHTDWIGDPPERELDEGDKHEIKNRLEQLGYI